MKVLSHFSLSMLLLAASSPFASAATLSCAQLRAAYEQDLMTSGADFVANDAATEARQLSQIRQTVLHFAGTDASDRSRERLNLEFGPIMTLTSVGSHQFEQANIDLGDNSFELLFDAGTTHFSGIAIEDGTVRVDGKYCADVEFTPVLTLSRQTAICEKIAPLVQEKAPRFDVAACLERSYGPSFYVENHTPTMMQVDVRGNLAHLNAVYFACEAAVNRATNVVTQVTCNVR